MWKLKLFFIYTEAYFPPENHQINEKELKNCMYFTYSIIKTLVLRKHKDSFHIKLLLFVKIPTLEVITTVRKYKLNCYFSLEYYDCRSIQRSIKWHIIKKGKKNEGLLFTVLIQLVLKIYVSIVLKKIPCQFIEE